MGGVSAPFGWKMLALLSEQRFQLGLAVDLSPKGDFETRKVSHFQYEVQSIITRFLFLVK